jgi:hypothetical protein
MEDGEDFLLRPVMEGMCRYESLKDGSLSLYDLMLMNEALDVRVENTYRLRKAEQQNGR